MDNKHFSGIRKILKKTQAELADLLGISVKAVHSYEQGWRKIPAHVERQIYFLLSRRRKKGKLSPCWTINKCPRNIKKSCPAWEFRAGDICWFINGTQCQGHARPDVKDAIARCRECPVLVDLIKECTEECKKDEGDSQS